MCYSSRLDENLLVWYRFTYRFNIWDLLHFLLHVMLMGRFAGTISIHFLWLSSIRFPFISFDFLPFPCFPFISCLFHLFPFISFHFFPFHSFSFHFLSFLYISFDSFHFLWAGGGFLSWSPFGNVRYIWIDFDSPYSFLHRSWSGLLARGVFLSRPPLLIPSTVTCPLSIRYSRLLR